MPYLLVIEQNQQIVEQVEKTAESLGCSIKIEKDPKRSLLVLQQLSTSPKLRQS